MNVTEDAVSKLVQYWWDEGLYVGTVRKVTEKMCEIEPIGGTKKNKRTWRGIPKEDVVAFVDKKK